MTWPSIVARPVQQLPSRAAQRASAIETAAADVVYYLDWASARAHRTGYGHRRGKRWLTSGGRVPKPGSGQ